MVHPPTASYQPDGVKPEDSIYDWLMDTKIYISISAKCIWMLITHSTLNERFCNSHQVYHAYLMKAHQFIKDYNIEDEESKETFLKVFGQSDDPEDDQPNPEDDLLEDDLPEDDLIEEDFSEDYIPEQKRPYLRKYSCTRKARRLS